MPIRSCAGAMSRVLRALLFLALASLPALVFAADATPAAPPGRGRSGHASITRIRIAPDGSMQVIAVGDVGHLPPNLQTGASGDPERSLENTVLAPAT